MVPKSNQEEKESKVTQPSPTSATSQPPLSKAEVTTDSPDLPREITITPEMVEEFKNNN